MHYRLWYRDLFDREMPPSIDAEGDDAPEVALSLLWRAVLSEGVVPPKGLRSFSAFWLELEARRVEIAVDLGANEGLERLREWAESRPEIVRAIAVTHSRLLDQPDCDRAIVGEALRADRIDDFPEALERL